MESLVSQKNFRAVAVAIGVAFLGGIGAYLATRTTNTIDRKLGGPSLVVRVLMPGDFRSDAALEPYYVIPSTDSTSVRRAIKDLHFAGSGPINPGAKQDSLDGWARARGATWGSPQRLRIELRARTKEPVIIQGITVNVVRRGPPIAGWYGATWECGGALVRQARIYLDSNPPRITYAQGEMGPGQHQLALSVTDTDVEILELWAITRTGDVEWNAELLYSGPEGLGRVKIDQAGKPFHVTSEVGSKGYANDGRSLARRTDWDSAGIILC